VLEDMDGRIDYILRGDVCDVGLESTVVDCINDPPVVLRAGRVTLQQIRDLFPGTVFARELAEQEQLIKASPGTRHAHYQPKATIELFETLSELAKIPLVKRAESALACLYDEVAPPETERSSCDGFVMQASFDSLETYGKKFYEFLREADRRGLKSIYLQLVSDCEQSHALRDRLLRAAGRT
jgi:L-threonylcarbamoyladenylate synthase